MSNTTRCKLICTHVGEVSAPESNPLRHVRFSGVTEQDDAIFGKYTPCADFSAVIQSAVAEQLEVGAVYYFDIRKDTEYRRPNPSHGAPKPANHNPVA